MPRKDTSDEFSLTKALSQILAHQPQEQVFAFLQAVLTEKELTFVEKRLRIARLLEQEYSYVAIQKELKVSAATVASVSDQMKQPNFQKLSAALERELARFTWWRKQKQ